MFLYQKQQGPRRSLASIAPYSPHGLVIGKQAAAMNLEIVGPGTYPDNNYEVVELVAYITQHLAATGVYYEWTLPEGVELVRGPQNNTLLNLPLGRAQQISILVRGFSTERQKLISLHSQLVSGGTPLGASAVVVSRPEDTTDAKVMDLQAQARAAAEEESKKGDSESR
ncbi:hypothetical protein [Bdellovibrio sp. HCB337]|uniref:hypothetical protein n=1 Tax=Bdellovibrio sp. HCB337 TaxID=3394358 RepID=UPI0039A4761C